MICRHAAAFLSQLAMEAAGKIFGYAWRKALGLV
jgi:hypothetical protein